MEPNANRRTVAPPADGRRLTLERVAYDPTTWDALVQGHPEAEVFHGAPWLEFLAASQRAEPVVAAVLDRDRVVGHFVGAIVRRFGIPILGSPLPGWTTQAMGFLLEPGVDRTAAVAALPAFAFRGLGCVHLGLADRHLFGAAAPPPGFHSESSRTFVVDLSGSEEEAFGHVRRTTRQEIRRAVRDGLTVEVAEDDAFSGEFHAYLRAVFARQGLAPTYDVERVRRLRAALEPAGQLLALRVRDPGGRCIGTSISVGRGRSAVAWGMAFDRDDPRFHAIELLWWETIRRWRDRGATRFDCGGGGEYKLKYGGVEAPTLRLHRSRYPGLDLAREGVRRLVGFRQVVRGRPAATAARIERMRPLAREVRR